MPRDRASRPPIPDPDLPEPGQGLAAADQNRGRIQLAAPAGQGRPGAGDAVAEQVDLDPALGRDGSAQSGRRASRARRMTSGREPGGAANLDSAVLHPGQAKATQ